MRSPNPAIERLNRAFLLPPAKAAALVGNLVSYLLHVPIADEQIEALSSPNMSCTLDLMVLASGTLVAIPTLRSQGTEMRILVPMVGVQARRWAKDCLMLGRMELLIASKSRAGCLCIRVENHHARWFRAAAKGPTRSPRSGPSAASELLQAATLLREPCSADVVDQWFWGVGASLDHVVRLEATAVPSLAAGPSST